MLTIPSTLLPALRNALGAIAGAKGGKLTVSPAGTDKAGNRLVTVTGEREVTYSALPLSDGAAGVILTMMGIELGGMLAGVGKASRDDDQIALMQAKVKGTMATIDSHKRMLAEVEADRDALQRTVVKLRQELETVKLSSVPSTIIFTFPPNCQGKILKAAGESLESFKAAGFKWKWHNSKETSEGGQWEAPESPASVAMMRKVQEFA